MDYEIVTRNKETSPMGILDIMYSRVNIACCEVNGIACGPPPVVNGSCGGNGGRGGCVTPDSAGLVV